MVQIKRSPTLDVVISFVWISVEWMRQTQHNDDHDNNNSALSVTSGCDFQQAGSGLLSSWVCVFGIFFIYLFIFAQTLQLHSASGLWCAVGAVWRTLESEDRAASSCWVTINIPLSSPLKERGSVQYSWTPFISGFLIFLHSMLNFNAEIKRAGR